MDVHSAFYFNEQKQRSVLKPRIPLRVGKMMVPFIYWADPLK